MTKPPIKRIKSTRIERGLSVMGIGLKTGILASKFVIQKVAGTQVNREMQILAGVEIMVKELDKLKGTFQKAGQFLGVLGEFFFPPEVNQILQKLQAQSTPLDWKQIEKVLVKNLGKEKLALIEIDKNPYAAASLGQVYRAKYQGKDIVLKVQYPGVESSIKSDIATLKTIFSLTKILPESEAFHEIFEEIKTMLIRETDYRKELESMEKIRALLPPQGPWIIPQVYPELSTKRILAMEFLEGVPFNDPTVQVLPQARRNKLGYFMLDLLFKEIFHWHMIQSDAHPGNYLVQVGEIEDKIILLDYGAVRQFSNAFIENFRKLSQATLDNIPEKVVKYGCALEYLRDTDTLEVNQMFFDICKKALTGFLKESESPSLDGSIWTQDDFHWAESEVVTHMAALAKSAIFKTRMRPPPPEAIFLDRKLAGIFSILSQMKVIYGPGKLLRSYLDWPHTAESRSR